MDRCMSRGYQGRNLTFSFSRASLTGFLERTAGAGAGGGLDGSGMALSDLVDSVVSSCSSIGVLGRRTALYHAIE
jgi:hypothetical protein